DKKQIYWNQESIKNIQEYLFNFKTVLFSPDDLSIIKGEPEKRRKFFDKSIFQISKNYFLILKEYEYFLKMRNQLLKEPLDYTKRRLLDVADEKFSNLAISIFKQRDDYLKKLQPFLNDILDKLTNREFSFKMEYNTEFDYSSDESFLKYLKSNISNEIIRKRTLSGIHLDDVIFIRNGKNIKNFGSQGEIRLSILAIKIAHINYLFSETGKYPTLLLDDLFSELDIYRKNYLLSYLKNRDTQTFITSTEIDESFFDIFSGDFQKFKVVNGKIE
ncbi:DNA replication and repair protein RecF, partial [bacterium]|nr:DNA replication and repair protein RecF [bacterium]